MLGFLVLLIRIKILGQQLDQERQEKEELTALLKQYQSRFGSLE